MDRCAQQKWPITQDKIKGGSVSETCRGLAIVPNLSYRRQDEAEQGTSPSPL
jgi:hypothetical protein